MILFLFYTVYKVLYGWFKIVLYYLTATKDSSKS